jgi:hypothetical protein
LGECGCGSWGGSSSHRPHLWVQFPPSRRQLHLTISMQPLAQAYVAHRPPSLGRVRLRKLGRQPRRRSKHRQTSKTCRHSALATLAPSPLRRTQPGRTTLRLCRQTGQAPRATSDEVISELAVSGRGEGAAAEGVALPQRPQEQLDMARSCSCGTKRQRQIGAVTSEEISELPATANAAWWVQKLSATWACPETQGQIQMGSAAEEGPGDRSTTGTSPRRGRSQGMRLRGRAGTRTRCQA